MAGRVFPIGYNLDGSSARVEELMSNPKTLLVDTRINPWSNKPEWCKRFVDRSTGEVSGLQLTYGKRYRQAGQYLGNLAHATNQAMRKRDRDNWQQPAPPKIQIANPAVGIATLRAMLTQGYDLILLCACSDYEHCHVHEIVRLLVEAMPDVEVILQSMEMNKR